MLLSLPLARRFWSAHPSLDSQAGFWEREVLGNWCTIAGRMRDSSQWLDKQYVYAYRIDYTTFQWLFLQCTEEIQRQDTEFRNAIPAAKKFAICLHWRANGLTETSLANEYSVGRSTVHAILHEVVSVLETNWQRILLSSRQVSSLKKP